MPRGYFNKNVPPLRMPRTHGQPDESGIRYDGDVLTGKISVEEAHARDARQALQAQMNDRERHPAGCYTTPENYDPVLRYHLRMGNPYYFDPDLKK